jgi:hypothetical protein
VHFGYSLLLVWLQLEGQVLLSSIPRVMGNQPPITTVFTFYRFDNGQTATINWFVGYTIFNRNNVYFVVYHSCNPHHLTPQWAP